MGHVARGMVFEFWLCAEEIVSGMGGCVEEDDFFYAEGCRKGGRGFETYANKREEKNPGMFLSS